MKLAHLLTIRVDDHVLARLDAAAEGIAGRTAPGIKVVRSDAHRAALDRGLDVLEGELGLAPTPPADDPGPPSGPRPSRRGGAA